jgi:hypothetical protein
MNRNDTRQNGRIDFVGGKIIRMTVDKTVSEINLKRKTRESNEPEPKNKGLAENDEKHGTLILTILRLKRK